MYALVGVLIGGRTLFVIADIITNHNAGDYFSHPLKFIAIWEGGMAFHGALVGVIVAILLFLRKHRGLSFGVLADEVVVLLSIGIFTTRVVNFINDELLGKVCLPDHPYCILFPSDPLHYRYPSQLFEGILDILTLPIVLLVYRSRPPDGVVAWTWFTLYGIARSIAEIWREPGFTVAGLSGGQLVAIDSINPELVPGARGEAALASFVAGWTSARVLKAGCSSSPRFHGWARLLGRGIFILKNRISCYRSVEPG